MANNGIIKRPKRVEGSILNEVLLGWEIIWIKLALENKTKRIILNFYNIYYLSYNLSNLINLSLLNNTNIYYDNEFQALYNKIS